MVFEDGCSLGKSWEQGGTGGSGSGYIHSYRYLRVCLSKVCFFFSLGSIGIDLLGWVSTRLYLPKAGKACAFVFFFFS